MEIHSMMQEKLAPLGREIVRLRGRGFAPLSWEGVESLAAAPALPEPAAALSLIHKLQPQGETPLALEQVFIRYAEAASNVYLPDRYAFLDTSTIKNFAADAGEGFAFLIGHDTCGLPYGRTFAGRFEQGLTPEGKIVERVTIALYMIRDHRPGGLSSPSTNEIDKGIGGGTIADVSMGFLPGATGWFRCNVCLQNYRACPHYRGWSDNMTLDEQIYARDVLDVPAGICTVSYVDWHGCEISGVYDGAVAGAGFK